MAVTGFQKPNFRAINLFRQRPLPALGGLFQQVLRLCRESGLASLGHVALDGTKIKAKASKHKAMNYGRMEKAEGEFADLVKEWLDQAEVTDLAEGKPKDKEDDEDPPEPPKVDPKAQRNFTAPEEFGSRPPEAADSSSATPFATGE